MTVIAGLDRLTETAHLVRHRRVALLAHPASVDRSWQPALKVLEGAGALVSVTLGPEHGWSGAAQDMEAIGTPPPSRSGDAQRRHHSLYGNDEKSLRPTEAMLQDIDLVVADLQDVGSRYYTFAWTAALCLEACAQQEIPLLVLDRPNPLTGTAIEGPGINEGYHSFVGLHDVPPRHGLTLGELLRLYAQEKGLDSWLQVLPMHGYHRELWFNETDIPWVMPSPNMPTTDTALVYPGMCLLEGTNISEGRGTTRPFEIIGAPWLNGTALSRRLGEYKLPGCIFRPVSFKPMFHKHKGQRCGGVQTHVTDRRTFRPFRTGVAMLHALREIGDPHFDWRREPYEFVADRLAIDLLAGGPDIREGVDACVSLDELTQHWRCAEEEFAQRRRGALLYDEDL